MFFHQACYVCHRPVVMLKRRKTLEATSSVLCTVQVLALHTHIKIYPTPQVSFMLIRVEKCHGFNPQLRLQVWVAAVFEGYRLFFCIVEVTFLLTAGVALHGVSGWADFHPSIIC